MIARILRKGPMMNPRFVYAAVALLAGVLVPATVFAQSDSSNQNVQDLRKQLDELREQMSKLQTRLGELENRASEAATAPTAPSAEQQGTIQSNQPLAQAAPSKQVGEATATYTTFSEDSVAAARFDNVPLDPKYKGFSACQEPRPSSRSADTSRPTSSTISSPQETPTPSFHPRFRSPRWSA